MPAQGMGEYHQWLVVAAEIFPQRRDLVADDGVNAAVGAGRVVVEPLVRRGIAQSAHHEAAQREIIQLVVPICGLEVPVLAPAEHVGPENPPPGNLF